MLELHSDQGLRKAIGQGGARLRSSWCWMSFTPTEDDRVQTWPCSFDVLKEFFGAKQLQVVGTSATLAGPGTYDQQQTEVAEVASVLFGAEWRRSADVIGETLQRATPEEDPDDPQFLAALAKGKSGRSDVHFTHQLLCLHRRPPVVVDRRYLRSVP